MGTCCAYGNSPEHNYTSVISHRSSFANSSTTNDNMFISFTNLPQLDKLLKTIIDNPSQFDQGKHTQLQQFLDLLNDQLANLSSAQSELSAKLSQIESKLTSQDLGYLVFQVQTIEMAKDKNARLSIQLRGTHRSQCIKKQLNITNYHAEVNLLAEWVVEQKGKICILINDSLSTIDTNELENRFVVVQTINIKKKGLLQPVGRVLTRVQYIPNVKVFRERYGSLLKWKSQQVRTLMSYREKKGLPDDKLIISMFAQDESRILTSFYNNDFQI